MTRRSLHAGFTLVELVAVITVLGVLAGVLALTVVQPFTADQDMRQRARLTDQADLIIDRIRREVRTAVPNSVRTENPAGNREAVEFVPTETGGRYRRLPAGGAGGGGDVLDLTGPSDRFDVLGRLPDINAIDEPALEGDGGIDDCSLGSTLCMNIFNTGQTNFDIYNRDNVGEHDNIAEITEVDNNATPNDFDDDQLVYDNNGADTPAFQAHSPNQRFVVFTDVVSYVCDEGSNELLRYDGYGLIENQPVADADFDTNVNVASNLVADDLTQCAFTYDPGAATRQGLLTIDIRIERGGEAVDLFAQIHVVNVP